MKSVDIRGQFFNKTSMLDAARSTYLMQGVANQ